jgi:hypothetical protein
MVSTASTNSRSGVIWRAILRVYGALLIPCLVYIAWLWCGLAAFGGRPGPFFYGESSLLTVSPAPGWYTSYYLLDVWAGILEWVLLLVAAFWLVARPKSAWVCLWAFSAVTLLWAGATFILTLMAFDILDITKELKAAYMSTLWEYVAIASVVALWHLGLGLFIRGYVRHR